MIGQEERTIKAAALKFNRKYNKEIEKIQNKFSSTISFASKVQKGLTDVNKKYNVELRESLKNYVQNNKAIVNFRKTATLFSAGLTVASQKMNSIVYKNFFHPSCNLRIFFNFKSS